MAKTVIAIDCMGTDNAPFSEVNGSIDALSENKEIYLKLVGKKDLIEKALLGAKYDKERVEIVDASEVIETGETPTNAIRSKKDSSIVKCLYMVKNGEADAMISGGSTGANLVGGHTIIGRIKGVDRPPLAPLIPTQNGMALLIDCGANVDAKPNYLLQFAQIGSIYMENVVGVKNPRVALVNIGAEEEKGNALVKETYPMLKELEGINFVGNIEARDIPKGAADVIVCDAFVGNVILKMYEGVGSVMLSTIKKSLMSNLKTKIGALLIKGSLKKSLKSFDTDQYGGAPLLGLKGLLVKVHGSSKAVEVKNSVLQCVTFKENDINGKIAERISINK